MIFSPFTDLRASQQATHCWTHMLRCSRLSTRLIAAVTEQCVVVVMVLGIWDLMSRRNCSP